MQTGSYWIEDGFLDDREFERVQEYALEERLDLVHASSSGVEQVWAHTDGLPRRGPPAVAMRGEHEEVFDDISVFPTHTAMDFVVGRLLQQAESLAHWLNGNWNAVTARLHCYPPGSGLSWHNDRSGIAGAFVFFVNPTWELDWGGELMLLSAPDHDVTVDTRTFRRRLLLEPSAAARGEWILPKPNRLVLLRPGIPHRIGLVSVNAGPHARTSISGFFQLHSPRT